MVSLKVFRVDISRGSSVKKMNCYLTTSCQSLTNGGLSFYLSVSSREAPLLKGLGIERCKHILNIIAGAAEKMSQGISCVALHNVVYLFQLVGQPLFAAELVLVEGENELLVVLDGV